MKKIITRRWTATVVMTIFVFIACKKPEPEITKPFINTAPVADAGKDTTIVYPVNSVVLDGSNSTDKENKIVSYSWKDISEPVDNNIYFRERDLGKSLVQNLENKIYQFELTVTDQWRVSSKDTITVSAIVEPPKPGNTKAVDDITLSLPYNLTYLQTIFKVTYPGSFRIIYNWKKISGPNSFQIHSPNSRNTGLGNLVEGAYQFELTVTYWNNLTEKDTMAVTVLPDNNVYTAEKLFENIVWLDGGNTYGFTINNISSIIPPGHAIKIYLKEDSIADWQIVVPDDGRFYSNLYQYRYIISGNSIRVYFGYDPIGGGGDWASTSTIKIVY